MIKINVDYCGEWCPFYYYEYHEEGCTYGPSCETCWHKALIEKKEGEDFPEECPLLDNIVIVEKRPKRKHQ